MGGISLEWAEWLTDDGRKALKVLHLEYLLEAQPARYSHHNSDAAFRAAVTLLALGGHTVWFTDEEINEVEGAHPGMDRALIAEVLAIGQLGKEPR